MADAIIIKKTILSPDSEKVNGYKVVVCDEANKGSDVNTIYLCK